jgi:hypothetical protein
VITGSVDERTDRGVLSEELGVEGRKRPPCPGPMTERSPFEYFRTSPEIIRLAVMPSMRVPSTP